MNLEILATITSQFRDFCQSFHHLFSRREVRDVFDGVMLGLLTAEGRKNSWQLTASIGLETPDPLQRFFSTTVWDEECALQLYQKKVLERFGSLGALIFDETGFLKKGSDSVGVQRQYSGTAGKIDNCQIGVFAAWVVPQAHLLWDRRLFLPKDWVQDKERREKTKVPSSVKHKSKPKLAKEMFLSALDRGAKPMWVGGDTIYGDDATLRTLVASKDFDYVFSVAAATKVWEEWPEVEFPEQVNPTKTGTGAKRKKPRIAKGQPKRIRVDKLAENWCDSRWKPYSAGNGSKGERLYDWAWQEVIESDAKLPSRQCVLLIRRSRDESREKAYFLCHTNEGWTPELLIGRAGARWPIEQCFEEAKGECGLDEYEVRSWVGWHRHVTLSMMAHGFLSFERAKQRAEAEKKSVSPAENSD